MTKNSIYVDVKFCLAAHEISFKVCTAQNFSSLFLFTLKSLPLLFLLNKLHNVVSFVICFIFQHSFLWIMCTLPRFSSWMLPFTVITIIMLIWFYYKRTQNLLTLKTYAFTLLCCIKCCYFSTLWCVHVQTLYKKNIDTIFVAPLW